MHFRADNGLFEVLHGQTVGEEKAECLMNGVTNSVSAAQKHSSTACLGANVDHMRIMNAEGGPRRISESEAHCLCGVFTSRPISREKLRLFV